MKADAPNVEFARCFLRLANLPNFALDRLSRYEAALWLSSRDPATRDHSVLPARSSTAWSPLNRMTTSSVGVASVVVTGIYPRSAPQPMRDGPVLRSALRRLASICRYEVMESWSPNWVRLVILIRPHQLQLAVDGSSAKAREPPQSDQCQSSSTR
jgi:hypothetical protein